MESSNGNATTEPSGRRHIVSLAALPLGDAEENDLPRRTPEPREGLEPSMRPKDVERFGTALFGAEFWQTELGRALGRQARYIAFLKSGERLTPPGFRDELKGVLDVMRRDHEEAVRLAESDPWTHEVFSRVGCLMFRERWRTELARRLVMSKRVVWDIARGDAQASELVVRDVKKILKRRPAEFDKLVDLLR